MSAMRIDGRLAKWNEDRGFGFIRPASGGPEVFIHVSAFPKDGCRPVVGERLSFEIEIDRSGKKRANKLLFPDRQIRPVPGPHTRRPSEHQPARRWRLVPVLLVAAACLFGYRAHISSTPPHTRLAELTDHSDVPQPPSTFRCDGRTHCSQMTSCAEAKYFLQNCPDVKMDGNHDGTPCEQQWCN
jgi:cold shock CspA family protein